MSQLFDTQPPMLPLVLSAALIAFTVAFSVDAEALDSPAAHSAVPAFTPSVMPYEPPTLAPSAIVINATPSFRSELGMVKFFFAPSKTEVPAGADSALENIARVGKEGQRFHIAGFHDATGNAQLNTGLAQKRAQAVYQRLVALGVPSSALTMKKPALAIDASSHAEARRVEVVWVR